MDAVAGEVADTLAAEAPHVQRLHSRREGAHCNGPSAARLHSLTLSFTIYKKQQGWETVGRVSTHGKVTQLKKGRTRLQWVKKR